MRPLYLYGENFTCFKKFDLNLSGISALLIMGRQDHNELESNAIGKTSLFRAIEYVLFAQTKHPILGKDIVLEKLIQDEAAKLLVVFDFEIDGQIYRITRARTRKGSTDLTFLKRNETAGNPHTPTTDKKLWTDLTCRRTADTDAEIYKLIRIRYKAFINTNHSMQLDVGGIATTTPEKRRAIFKDVFDLAVYASLERIVKQRAEQVVEEIKHSKIVIETLGEPLKDAETIKQQVISIDRDIANITTGVKDHEEALKALREQQLTKTATLSALEKSASSVLAKRTSLTGETEKLNTSIADYTKKRKVLIVEAKAITSTLQSLKSSKENLTGIDFSYLTKLNASLEATTTYINQKTVELGIVKSELEELNIPMPDDGTCKHCRQILTPEHRRACVDDIEKQKVAKSSMITGLTNYIETLKVEQAKYTSNIKQLEQQQKQLNEALANIKTKEKELNDKRSVCSEYDELLKRFNADLEVKQAELIKAQQEVKDASEQEIEKLTGELNEMKQDVLGHQSTIAGFNTQLNTLQSKKAVASHSIDQKAKDAKQKDELLATITKLEDDYASYPHVIEAFASIPDVIIENVLEGLQEESNKLLTQIRPELQLEFATEKTKSDGEQGDTLEISYYLNNKPKDISQLSGAQQFSVMFALKLGLSFYLAKMNGSQIKFLMLDEVEAPFSHAAVDAYADIIRFFQKDFTVFVITHNDRLKTKFSNAILIEQDGNGVSRAKVVNSW